MRDTTLCLLFKEKQVLLAMKKRGFGAGRWNGVGGKLNPWESIEEAAIREMAEEIGVHGKAEDLEKVAILEFYFKEKPEWNQKVHVFSLKKWEGEPTESEEMKPQWYGFHEIPYGEMWPDDKDWLPLVLDGKKAAGKFYFADGGSTFDSIELQEVPGF